MPRGARHRGVGNGPGGHQEVIFAQRLGCDHDEIDALAIMRVPEFCRGEHEHDVVVQHRESRSAGHRCHGQRERDAWPDGPPFPPLQHEKGLPRSVWLRRLRSADGARPKQFFDRRRSRRYGPRPARRRAPRCRRWRVSPEHWRDALSRLDLDPARRFVSSRSPRLPANACISSRKQRRMPRGCGRWSKLQVVRRAEASVRRPGPALGGSHLVLRRDQRVLAGALAT